MLENKNTADKDKIKLIKEIYRKTLFDIDKIEKERDEKIKELLKTIDGRHINKILKDIKNTK